MTLRGFRLTYQILASFGVLFLLGAALFGIQVATDRRVVFFLADEQLYTEFFVFGIPVGMHLVGALEIIGLVLAAAGLLIGIMFSFRKTVSAEVSMIALWLLSVGFETVRLPVLLMSLKITSIGMLGSLSKAVVGARFAGLISLFISSLHAVGYGRDRLQNGYLIALLGGVILAGFMPVSIDRFLPSFLLATGYREISTVVTISILLLSLIDYLVASRLREEPSYALVGFAVTGAAASWIWLWDLRAPLVGLAAIACFAGLTALVLRKLHDIYIW